MQLFVARSIQGIGSAFSAIAGMFYVFSTNEKSKKTLHNFNNERKYASRSTYDYYTLGQKSSGEKFFRIITEVEGRSKNKLREAGRKIKKHRTG